MTELAATTARSNEWIAVVTCVVAAAAVVRGRRPRARRRLSRLPRPGRVVPPPARPAVAPVAPPTPVVRSPAAVDVRRRRVVDRVRLVAALGAVAVLLLFAGGWFGVLAGATVGVVLDRVLRRMEPAVVRARRLAEVADLPLAVDLVAAVLRSGAPVDRAVGAVAQTLPGPLAERLTTVAHVLRLGGTAAEAWAELESVAGADRLIRAAVRSADHGGALASALTRLADDLRANRTIAADAAARRSGVLIVLPLGLCFLPAFILAGLVPVIVAVLGDVL